MPEITCSIVEDLLGAYLSGNVSEETKRLLSEHINECPRCSTMVKLRSQTASKMIEQRLDIDKGQARKIVGRARRKLYINLGLIVILVLALASLGLNDLYAHAVAAPLDVAGAKAYAELAIPGAKLARALGKAVDYDMRLTNWLTIDSIYFTEYNQAYLLYTTTDGTRLSIDLINGSKPSTPENAFPPRSVRVSTIPPVYYISGGRSQNGHHFAVPLNLTNEELSSMTCKITVSPSYRVKRSFGLWSIRKSKVGKHIPVTLEWSAQHLEQDVSLVYQLNEEINVGETTLQITELELNSQFTRLQVITDRSAGATRASLNLVWDGVVGKDNVLSARSINSVGNSRSVRDELLFPPMPELPQAVRVHVNSLQMQKSGHMTFQVPWGKYATRGQLLVDEADQFSLDVDKGKLSLVAVDTERNRIIFKFSSHVDPSEWPANTSPLSPYSFPPEILGSGGSKQRSGGSYIHAPNEPDLRYGIVAEPNTLVVELEVDDEFASANPLLTLLVQQGPYNMDVNEDFALNLPKPEKVNPSDPE